jgi:CBS domain-containing protein
MKIQVNDFMTTAVIAAQITDSIGEIRAIMQREGIHAIPIVENSDGNILVQGIVTSTDLSCQLDDKLPVEKAFNFSKVHVLHTNSSAKAAAEMMLKHHVHHLVVMENGKLVGMVSSLDFVKLVAEYQLDEKIKSA